MKIFDIKKTNRFFSFAVLCLLVPSLTIASIVVAELKCGSDQTKNKDVELPALYVHAEDTSAATIAVVTTMPS